MSFDYTQEEITRLAKENNFTVAGIEKVMRLSNILNDLNNRPEFSGKLLLKGGTAINLLVFDLPRLSVDLDLDFSKNVSKEDMLAEREQINKALDSYFQQNGYRKTERSNFTLDSLSLHYNTVTGSGDKIKLDINYHNRSHIFKPEVKSIEFPFIRENKTSFVVNYVNPIELFAGKIKAFYERCKPRDIYDLFSLASSDILTSKEERDLLRKSIVFYSSLGNPENKDMLKADPKQSIENVTFMEIRQQLLPMMHTNSGKYPMQEINDKVADFVSSLMKLEPSEELYLSNFYAGKYKPDLLFSDKEILNNIQDHPIIIRTQQQITDSIFSDSIKKNDFARIAGLKDEGYIPSPKIIDELKGSAPAPTMIAVQKIFGLPSDAPGLSNIKLAQSDNVGLGKDKSNDLKI